MIDDKNFFADGFWVFGYGSLLWQPEFEAVREIKARANGFSRSFCMWSIHHRGTVEEPGLVLALDKGAGFCDGVAFRIAKEDSEKTLQDLRDRELISSAYYEEICDLTLETGETIQALAYVINQEHDQYCLMPLETQAQVIAKAVGGRGPNIEYLTRTKSQLDALGIGDEDIDWLTNRVLELHGQA